MLPLPNAFVHVRLSCTKNFVFQITWFSNLWTSFRIGSFFYNQASEKEMIQMKVGNILLSCLLAFFALADSFTIYV
jgi:hypothetical protein